MKNPLQLEAHESDRGNLYVGTGGKEIPFEVKRFYVIKDTPRGKIRGAHAHKETEQALFCLQGSFDLLLDDGSTKETVHVDSINNGFLLQKGVWHSLENISEDCIMLVLCNTPYDEADYIRDYQEFLTYIRS